MDQLSIETAIFAAVTSHHCFAAILKKIVVLIGVLIDIAFEIIMEDKMSKVLRR